MEPDLYNNSYVAQRLREAIGACGGGSYSKSVAAYNAIVGLGGVVNFKEVYDASGRAGVLSALKLLKDRKVSCAKSLLTIIAAERGMMGVFEMILQGMEHADIVRRDIKRQFDLCDTPFRKTI